MQISTFTFQEEVIRIVSINNNPWFIAKDVFKVLEVKNPSQALTRLEPEERSTIILNEGTDGNPNINIISESGFYTIVLSSRKVIAKPFKNWVTREVLPQLRHQGYYQVPNFTPNVSNTPTQPVQEDSITVLTALVTNLNILIETKQQVNKVEEITKLHTGALQELESLTSNRHSLVVDRLCSIEERLNLQSHQVQQPEQDNNLNFNHINAALSSFNYVNPQHVQPQAKNGASLHTLPSPTQQLPEISIETHLNNIVKSYVIKQQCQNNDITFQTAYNLLYKKFLDIFHINIKARCEEHNRHYSPKLTVLKYAVKFDLIQDLYNTAYNLFITGNI